MSIDIEKLLEEIDEDGSGEIEFDEFELLLKSDYTDELPGDYDEDADWLGTILNMVFFARFQFLNLKLSLTLTPLLLPIFLKKHNFINCLKILKIKFINLRL